MSSSRFLIAPGLLVLLLSLSACSAPAPSPTDTPPTPAVSAASSAPAEPQTDEAAVAAFKKWAAQYNDNDWESQYQTLVAAQREIISEKAYVACRDKDAAPQFEWLRLVSTKAGVETKIPGTSVKLPATVVVTRFRVSDLTLPITAHMFYEQGAWHWSMTKENIEGCGTKE